MLGFLGGEYIFFFGKKIIHVTLPVSTKMHTMLKVSQHCRNVRFPLAAVSCLTLLTFILLFAIHLKISEGEKWLKLTCLLFNSHFKDPS